MKDIINSTWDTLDMSTKASIMKEALLKGITDIDIIKKNYDSKYLNVNMLPQVEDNFSKEQLYDLYNKVEGSNRSNNMYPSNSYGNLFVNGGEKDGDDWHEGVYLTNFGARNSYRKTTKYPLFITLTEEEYKDLKEKNMHVTFDYSKVKKDLRPIDNTTTLLAVPGSFILKLHPDMQDEGSVVYFLDHTTGPDADGNYVITKLDLNTALGKLYIKWKDEQELYRKMASNPNPLGITEEEGQTEYIPLEELVVTKNLNTGELYNNYSLLILDSNTKTSNTELIPLIANLNYTNNNGTSEKRYIDPLGSTGTKEVLSKGESNSNGVVNGSPFGELGGIEMPARSFPEDSSMGFYYPGGYRGNYGYYGYLPSNILINWPTDYNLPDYSGEYDASHNGVPVEKLPFIENDKLNLNDLLAWIQTLLNNKGYPVDGESEFTLPKRSKLITPKHTDVLLTESHVFNNKKAMGGRINKFEIGGNLDVFKTTRQYTGKTIANVGNYIVLDRENFLKLYPELLKAFSYKPQQQFVLIKDNNGYRPVKPHGKEADEFDKMYLLKYNDTRPSKTLKQQKIEEDAKNSIGVHIDKAQRSGNIHPADIKENRNRINYISKYNANSHWKQGDGETIRINEIDNALKNKFKPITPTDYINDLFENIRYKAYKNIDPLGYEDAGWRAVKAMFGTNERGNEDQAKVSIRDNVWGEYMNIPSSKRYSKNDPDNVYSNTVFTSEFKPTKGNLNNTYYSFPSGSEFNPYINDVDNKIFNDLLNTSGTTIMQIKPDQEYAGSTPRSIAGSWVASKGYDPNRGTYISAFDEWNLEPSGGSGGNDIISKAVGAKPISFYNRYYLDDLLLNNNSPLKDDKPIFNNPDNIYINPEAEIGTYWLPGITVEGKPTFKSNGGKINKFENGGNKIYLEENVYSPFTINGITYGIISSLIADTSKGISDLEGNNVVGKPVYVKYNSLKKKWENTTMAKDADNIRAYENRSKLVGTILGISEDGETLYGTLPDLIVGSVDNKDSLPATYDEKAKSAGAYDPYNNPSISAQLNNLFNSDPVIKELRRRIFDTHLKLYNASNFLNTIIPMHLISPTNYVGALGEAARGNANFFLNALSGRNRGLFSLSDDLYNWSTDHPYISTGINIIGDMALGAAAAKPFIDWRNPNSLWSRNIRTDFANNKVPFSYVLKDKENILPYFRGTWATITGKEIPLQNRLLKVIDRSNSVLYKNAPKVLPNETYAEYLKRTGLQHSTHVEQLYNRQGMWDHYLGVGDQDYNLNMSINGRSENYIKQPDGTYDINLTPDEEAEFLLTAGVSKVKDNHRYTTYDYVIGNHGNVGAQIAYDNNGNLVSMIEDPFDLHPVGHIKEDIIKNVSKKLQKGKTRTIAEKVLQKIIPNPEVSEVLPEGTNILTLKHTIPIDKNFIGYIWDDSPIINPNATIDLKTLEDVEKVINNGTFLYKNQ